MSELSPFTLQKLRSVERRICADAFRHPELLLSALTQTFGNGTTTRTQECLAIKGDSLVCDALMTYLVVHHPHATDKYHGLRCSYLSNQYQAEQIILHNLDRDMIGHYDGSVHALATVYEALIGAMFLNDGDRGPRAFIYRTLIVPVERELRAGVHHRQSISDLPPATAIRLYALRRFEVGTWFERLPGLSTEQIRVRLIVPDRYACTGSGPTVAAAEEAAALEAMQYFNHRGARPDAHANTGALQLST